MENQKDKMSKTEYAREFIRSRIVDGTYGPGYRIVIDQIAKQLKLSIIPVREAIRQLEADGLIQYKRYSGAIVSKINEKEYLETLSVLAVLEGYATALSSRLITVEAINKLEYFNTGMNEALFNFEFEQFGELNNKFHTLIYENCGNSYLKKEIKQIWQRMDRVRKSGFTFVPQRIRESVKEHDLIIKMMKNHEDFSKIEEYARQHKLNMVSAFQSRKTKIE
ncbi:GntR family transcriptional regulator [Pseudalkalibacillus decolorationis]|uniref:GntR family transcriptional regulator n=1 Tax=Pseudalkalibacillus decolorationis TaxID=163879 RepID=UPI002148F593|nr:GntR family transcriptional regulator [Pseudalkalibacillus decolorationis]